MNYQTYNNYHYYKSKVIWWLQRRVDNEYIRKAGRYTPNTTDPQKYLTYGKKTMKRISEDLK